MSLVVQCDVCGRVAAAAVHSPVAVYTVATMRAIALGPGWRHDAEHGDRCPACVRRDAAAAPFEDMVATMRASAAARPDLPPDTRARVTQPDPEELKR